MFSFPQHFKPSSLTHSIFISRHLVSCNLLVFFHRIVLCEEIAILMQQLNASSNNTYICYLAPPGELIWI
jgi:hypothetical protein